jgi:hypothetical protein
LKKIAPVEGLAWVASTPAQKGQGLKCIWLLPLAKLKVCRREKDGGPMVDLSLQAILSTLP